MDYVEMIMKLDGLGIDTYSFKDFTRFRNKRTQLEVIISRDLLPRKNATTTQCEYVFDYVINKLGERESETIQAEITAHGGGTFTVKLNQKELNTISLLLGHASDNFVKARAEDWGIENYCQGSELSRLYEEFLRKRK